MTQPPRIGRACEPIPWRARIAADIVPRRLLPGWAPSPATLRFFPGIASPRNPGVDALFLQLALPALAPQAIGVAVRPRRRVLRDGLRVVFLRAGFQRRVRFDHMRRIYLEAGAWRTGPIRHLLQSATVCRL